VKLALFAETFGTNATSVQKAELALIMRLSINIAARGAGVWFSNCSALSVV